MKVLDERKGKTWLAHNMVLHSSKQNGPPKGTNESNRNIPRWCVNLVQLNVRVEASHGCCPWKHNGSHEVPSWSGCSIPDGDPDTELTRGVNPGNGRVSFGLKIGRCVQEDACSTDDSPLG